jgi:4-hydroxy-tetrahydrodipicolinate synthase
MTDRRIKENTVKLEGVWIPVVTPFLEGRVDLESLGRLVDHLVPLGISGIVAAATTGECVALTDEEVVEVVGAVKKTARGRVPVIAGIGHADTRKAVSLARGLEAAGVDGVLCVVPSYVRPDQRGISAHFHAIASETDLPLVLYNIPYRTGVNMANATIRGLARIDSVVGLKDSSGDMKQSSELLLDLPEKFSVLAGEDAFFYPMLTLGARGGILASAHWATGSFVDVWRAVRDNDHVRAREYWKALFPIIPMFFEEPNPAPLKHLLYSQGFIASPEVRLPLVAPTEGLKRKLETLAEAGSRLPALAH